MRTVKTLIRLADAQADLSLRWAHSHIVGFVISRPNCNQASSSCRNGATDFEHYVLLYNRNRRACPQVLEAKCIFQLDKRQNYLFSKFSFYYLLYKSYLNMPIKWPNVSNVPVLPEFLKAVSFSCHGLPSFRCIGNMVEKVFFSSPEPKAHKVSL